MAEKYAKQKDTLFDTFSLIEKKKSLAAIGPIFPAKKPSPPCLPYGQVKKKKNYKYVCPAGKQVFYGPIAFLVRECQLKFF